MRCQEQRAIRMITIMKSLGVKSAEDMSLEDACRTYSRVQRGTVNNGVPMSAAQLAHASARRRRARQTHPGKR
jgi:hypothetical protein